MKTRWYWTVFSKYTADQATEHSPSPFTATLVFPWHASALLVFHPLFAGCLSTAIWTKMMSHLSSKILLLTFPHSITFSTLNWHVLRRAHALEHNGLQAEHRTSIPDGPHFAKRISSRALKENHNQNRDQMGFQGESYKLNQ